MERSEFESAARADGFSIVHSSLKPHTSAPNHCHDFDARLFVLAGEITITRDNAATTFRAGTCCEVPCGTMHTEQVGPEGVAFVSARRRPAGALTAEAFESDCRREGFTITYSGQKPNTVFEPHTHGDDELRIMVLAGTVTVVRGNTSETFAAGQHCVVDAYCLHSDIIGPEGAAYIVARRPARPA
jgi:mannose-6-phosphate isomerase-like protein (cupin superfamily)